MHVSKDMLGLGLFLPSTMIAIQAMRMYLGNKRISSNASRMIAVLEEQIWVEEGRNQHPINHKKEMYWTPSWVDEIKKIMETRDMTLQNYNNRSFVITKNKTIMEFAVVHADKVMNNQKLLKLINHVRLFKEVFLPFELVGGSGRDETEARVHEMQKSQIKWTFYSGSVNQPDKIAFKVWKAFVGWLKRQQIKTVCDFNEHAHWEMQLRKDNKILIVKKLEGNEACVLNEKNEYQRVELDKEFKEEEFRDVIARLNKRGVLKVQYEEVEHREEMMPEET